MSKKNAMRDDSQQRRSRHGKWLNEIEACAAVGAGKIMVSLNKVLLIGQVAPEGVKFGYNENHTPEAIWTIVVDEPGTQGALFKTLIPCVAYAKAAQAIVETLQAGQTVFLEGRLKFRAWMTTTRETKSRLEVVTWMVQPLGICTSTDRG